MLCVFLLSMLGLRAQPTEAYQTWVDYSQKNKINEKWFFISDYRVRYSSPNQASFSRIHARPSMVYVRNSKHSFYGGLGIFYTDYFNNSNMLEYRPWQGYKLKWPSYNRLKVVHYFRLEQRITDHLDSDILGFNLKFRYQIGTNIPLNNREISVGTFYIPLSFEILQDVVRNNGSITSNQFRATTGLGYRVSKDLRIRATYIFQGTDNLTEYTMQRADHILRVSVIQSFGN